MAYVSTVKDIKEIVKQLKAENNPKENNELINFYENKILEATIKATSKAFNDSGLRFSVRLKK